jgi:hypothetical protein
MLLKVQTRQHLRPLGVTMVWHAMVRNERRDFCYFRHVLGPQATYRVSKPAKIVLENHPGGRRSGVAWCVLPHMLPPTPFAAAARETMQVDGFAVLQYPMTKKL